MREPIRTHLSHLSDDEHRILLEERLGEGIVARIDGHNWRIAFTWLVRGSNCQPFRSSPSTVPAAADLSRVVAAEHGGSVLEVRS